MAAESVTEVHHGAPGCLLGLFDAAATGLTDRSECGAEAAHFSIEVRGLSREDLRALIAGSTREISTTEHRRLHQEASDFVRWGRRGGRRTLALYGRPYFSLLARLRWGRIELGTLIEHRAGSSRVRVAATHSLMYNHGVRVHNQERRRVVEEVIGRLPELTEAQLGRLEDQIRRERRRRASSAGDWGQDAPRIQGDAAPPVTEVLEYRPHEDGYLQLELRRYIRRDGSSRERGPYWYFQYHEGGKRRKLYLGKTSDPESTLATKRTKPLGE
jgi:hypothetical protein